ncbi:REST corepressor 3 [Trichoplax sp. H2]|uniref:REST corepressor n=1 Tax=Trichoplax adhaerens TaxID=10228 RepID=B3RKW9_TRIAD|nr:hypothetical protein TRIADDRAFT_51793 [Trichoplax adhaerens]EDV28660.1 hypothetical protein TRIADDRAFT_51793 [Trichoplax adhaerens]RDD38499.1 REST corepressor 3 [Trichoplax sp. H2]|eukprot:XP_002107862.1 hypothetical protein TRIADDRAFT_51793 [Trichoplax adhaerens]
MSQYSRTSMGLRSMIRNKESIPQPSPPLTHNSSSENESDSDYEPGMRVGKEYQAVIPDVITGGKATQDRATTKIAEETRIWAPEVSMSDAKIDEFIHYAKTNFGYSLEQALGMLYWHEYDIEKSKEDLANFAPYPNEWSMEDEVLFEQAFDFHGKHFHQIKAMLPDKSVGSLVRYYYSWKKRKSRLSLLDRQARKPAVPKDATSCENSAEESSDSDFEPSKGRSNGISSDSRVCSNCGSCVTHLHSTPKGSICNACYQYWRRTGMMRSNVRIQTRTENEKGKLKKHKRRPPKGMRITREALMVIVKGNHENDSRIFENEIIKLKSQVQRNKQVLSELDEVSVKDIERYRLPESGVRSNARWTTEELNIAVEAVRRYGKDYHAIAEVVGNKTVNQCRNFFVNYRRRFNLLQILEEFEATHGKKGRSEWKENGTDDDLSRSPTKRRKSSQDDTDKDDVSELMHDKSGNGSNNSASYSPDGQRRSAMSSLIRNGAS